MEELINAIQALKQRDAWDYVAMFVPLLLSSVAIWISIRATTKQNKIALFEKRYKSYSVLIDLVFVAKSVVDDASPDRCTKLNNKIKQFLAISHPDIIIRDNDYPSLYLQLSMEANRIEYLFRLKNMKFIDAFLNALNEYIILCYANQPSDAAKKMLAENLQALENSKVLLKIDKDLRL